LYGMLRPLDGINPYRMDGAFSLPCTGGGKVFSFWRDRLTELLIRSTKQDDGVLVYLDTDEFRSLFDWKKVCDEIKVIEPRFRVRKSGKVTSPSVWTKSCRGAMARFIIDGRISSPEALCDFSFEGFQPSDAVAEDWTWIRSVNSHCRPD
ncbi:MAG: YaaA family protein, partial [Bacteroidales bacterium]|nr:YaaA family protein [Bacteroidales bacterium]